MAGRFGMADAAARKASPAEMERLLAWRYGPSCSTARRWARRWPSSTATTCAKWKSPTLESPSPKLGGYFQASDSEQLRSGARSSFGVNVAGGRRSDTLLISRPAELMDVRDRAEPGRKIRRPGGHDSRQDRFRGARTVAGDADIALRGPSCLPPCCAAPRSPRKPGPPRRSSTTPSRAQRADAALREFASPVGAADPALYEQASAHTRRRCRASTPSERPSAALTQSAGLVVSFREGRTIALVAARSPVQPCRPSAAACSTPCSAGAPGAPEPPRDVVLTPAPQIELPGEIVVTATRQADLLNRGAAQRHRHQPALCSTRAASRPCRTWPGRSAR